MPTTQELAELLLESSPEHKGWSIVESANAKGQYQALLEWASSTTIHTWHSDSKLRIHQLGLVLLWLESEVARRHAGEGTLWPILSNRDLVPWNPWVHQELFTVDGHATQIHRDLLRGAAQRYCLRNTFGTAEGQHWYRLIFLQFGFTHEDAIQRLAHWLSGQVPPIGVQLLLHNADSGARAFRMMWNSLRMFRLGNLSRDALKTRLQSNPWTLPEWFNDLANAAQNAEAIILHVDDLDATEIKFFTRPRLNTQANDTPYFVTSLCNLDKMALSAPGYELQTDGQILARLVRQPDGSYHSDCQELINLPLRPTISLSLVSEDGKIHATDQVVLWDQQEEVSVYSQKTGLMIPPNVSLRAGVALILITSADVSIFPQPLTSMELGLGYTLHHLNSGWRGQIEASLDEDVIWTSHAAEAAKPENTIGVAARFPQGLNLAAQGGNAQVAPWALPVQFHFPAGWRFVRLRWRRADGNVVQLTELPTHITVVEADVVKPIMLRVRVTNGALAQTVVLRVPVDFTAALYWTKEGRPHHHPPTRKILLNRAQQHMWSFNLPVRNGIPTDNRTCSFLEGHLLHGRVKNHPSAFPNLAGYGASLQIVEDPYVHGTLILPVSPCVVDGGVLGNVTRREEEAGFHIKSSFTEIGNDHRLTAWFTIPDGQSKVEAILHDAIERREDGWFWPVTEEIKLHAIALTFRSTRIGSWFDFRWSNFLLAGIPNSVPETAALLRKWKAPLLQTDQQNFERVSQWFRTYWLDILPVWLAPEQAPGPNGESWPMPPCTGEWKSVVREFLLASLPELNRESVKALVSTLAPGHQGASAIGTAIWKIADVCPILAIRVAKIYLRDEVISQERAHFFECFLNFDELKIGDERADEIARKHGNRDGLWLQQTIPALGSFQPNRAAVVEHAFRILCNSKEYRHFALGKWLREIY